MAPDLTLRISPPGWSVRAAGLPPELRRGGRRADLAGSLVLAGRSAAGVALLVVELPQILERQDRGGQRGGFAGRQLVDELCERIGSPASPASQIAQALGGESDPVTRPSAGSPCRSKRPPLGLVTRTVVDGWVMRSMTAVD